MSLWRVLVIVTAAGCGSSKSTPCEEGFSRDGSGHCVLEESGDTGLAVDDTGTPTVHPRMDLGPLQPCSDPADSVSYSDVSVAWGIAEPAFVVDEHSEAAATAVADFDADGDLDLFLGGNSGGVVFFRNGN